MIVDGRRILDVRDKCCIPVGSRAIANLDRFAQAGAYRANPREAGVGGLKSNGVARLQRAHNRQLPSGFEAIALERQFVDAAENQPVGGIVIGKATVTADVVAVLHSQALHIARVVIDRLGPGVRSIELQSP